MFRTYNSSIDWKSSSSETMSKDLATRSQMLLGEAAHTTGFAGLPVSEDRATDKILSKGIERCFVFMLRRKESAQY